MNRNISKQIAEKITNEQLLQMFINAKNNIKDWNVVSNVNKGLTKGTAWNILAKDFNVNIYYNNLTKINMIREFGEYLPEELKIKNVKNVSVITLIHQEPNFDKFI